MKKSNLQLIKNMRNNILKKIKYEKLNSSVFKSKLINFSRQVLTRRYYKTVKIKNLIERLQDKVENIGGDNSNQVIIKQSTFWASAITWVLMGGTAFALGWISIAKTDEVVIAIGKLEPKSGVIDVQMPVQGVIESILVKEGETVKKDQILMVLDNEITEAENQSLRKQLDLNNNILEKLRLIVSEGAVSEFQYLQQQAKVEDIKSQMKANLVKLKYQKIISPADGRVFELLPKGPGYVAQTSQPILKIVPLDQLIAKIEIDSRTIGFVKKGRKAEISIDSFPASDFGAIEGTITRIGSDALPPIPSQGKGYRFPANITLENQYLELKSGKRLPLQSGMSLNANIKLRKVTFLQLLLNKFVDKADSLKAI